MPVAFSSQRANIINSKSNVAYCNFARISLNAICTVLSCEEITPCFFRIKSGHPRKKYRLHFPVEIMSRIKINSLISDSVSDLQKVYKFIRTVKILLLRSGLEANNYIFLISNIEEKNLSNYYI